MATKKTKVMQYQGPFKANEPIAIKGDKCKIGISVGEKDFMNPSGKEIPIEPEDNTSENIHFSIQIGEGEEKYIVPEICIGRTYIYQVEQPLEKVSITFLDDAPNSTLIEVIYETE